MIEVIKTGPWCFNVSMLGRILILSSLILFAASVQGVFADGPEPEMTADSDPNYSFIFLGDLHFDRPRHHDMEWVKENYPNDVRQIQNYCRVTEENTPSLFKSISTVLKQQREAVFAILQAGDFVEGLCGRYQLQSLQFEDAKTFVQEYFPHTLFLLTKGNHDITGPDADKAYQDTILPWLGSQLQRNVPQSSYTVNYGGDLFVFFDAYNPDLDWLEATLEKSTARYTFLILHKPVVPFNARSNWHLFAENKFRSERTRLLDVLGRHKVIVLCGHLHDYSLLSRKTPNGRFVQLSMGSVLSDRDMTAKHALSGNENYTPDLVNFEPLFSPHSVDLRKQNLENEKPEIEFFDYAQTAGYSRVRVYPDKVVVEIYLGASVRAWKTHDITALLNAGSSPAGH